MLKLDMFSKCFERCIVLPLHQKTRQGLCCCCWVWQARHVAEHWKLKDSAGPPWSCERVNTVGGFSTVENKSSPRIWRTSVGSLKEWKFKRESDSKCFSEWRMHFLYQWRNVLMPVPPFSPLIKGQSHFSHFWAVCILLSYSISLGWKTTLKYVS